MSTAKSISVCDGRSAEETFFAAYESFLDQCPPPLAEGSIGARPRIHDSAVIEPSVTLGDDVVIGPGSRILGDTVIGDRAVVKANATIGGEGFETKILGGRRATIRTRAA